MIQDVLQDKIINHDPWALSDMQKAVDRINLAIDKSERILVYGDYDADGVTSTTILVNTLSQLGAQVGWYILTALVKDMVQTHLLFKMHMKRARHLSSLLIMVSKGTKR